jgi:hypothetical protein
LAPISAQKECGELIASEKEKSIMKISKDNFAYCAKIFGYQVEPEFKFAPNRKFRADWKITKNQKSCLVEYEGIKGKSRHTSIKGYSTDCEKYNLAQVLGYSVFRYTMLNFDQVITDLEKFYANL